MNLGRWWWIAALIVATVLAIVVVAHPGPLPGEVGYIRWLQDVGEPVPSTAEFVRLTTGTEAALVVAAIPIGFLFRYGGRAGWIAAAIALGTMLVAQPVFKEIIDRPRPTAEQVDVRAEHESMSFPSGHSMSTTTIWGAAVGTTWALGRRRWAAVAAVPIVLTFFSSAVQGVHWPSDSLAGTLLGAVAAWFVTDRLRVVHADRTRPRPHT